MTLKPESNFINGHVFESKGFPYYYDMTSQEIIVLDPAMAAVIPYFTQCQAGNVPPHLQRKFSHDEIINAVQTIEDARNSDNLFSSLRPVLVHNSKPEKPSQTAYASNLQHLVLTLTENCNLRCRYCLHGASLDWVRPHGHKSMALETALKATRYFLDRCCTEEIPAVSFYGGEALLQVELLAAVVKEVRSHPRGEQVHLVIDTNGVLLDDAVIRLVVENKMYLQISLDGPREYHDSQRPDARGNGTFDRIMEALDKLLELDTTAHQRLSFISTVAPPANLIELDDFFGDFTVFARFGIKSQLNLRINLANLNGQYWPATADEFHDLGDQLKSLREQYFEKIASGQRDTLGPVVKGLVEPGLFRLHHRSKAPLGRKYTPGGNCKPGIRKLHVTVDGRFQPCERTGDMLDLGSVKGGIDPTAAADLQKDFFEAVHENCTHCWALRLCRVCYAGWAENGDGSHQSLLPNSLCNSVRAQVEQDLKLLVRILELPDVCKAYLDDVTIA